MPPTRPYRTEDNLEDKEVDVPSNRLATPGWGTTWTRVVRNNVRLAHARGVGLSNASASVELLHLLRHLRLRPSHSPRPPSIGKSSGSPHGAGRVRLPQGSTRPLCDDTAAPTALGDRVFVVVVRQRAAPTVPSATTAGGRAVLATTRIRAQVQRDLDMLRLRSPSQREEFAIRPGRTHPRTRCRKDRSNAGWRGVAVTSRHAS